MTTYILPVSNCPFLVLFVPSQALFHYPCLRSVMFVQVSDMPGQIIKTSTSCHCRYHDTIIMPHFLRPLRCGFKQISDLYFVRWNHNIFGHISSIVETIKYFFYLYLGLLIFVKC